MTTAILVQTYLEKIKSLQETVKSQERELDDTRSKANEELRQALGQQARAHAEEVDSLREQLTVSEQQRTTLQQVVNDSTLQLEELTKENQSLHEQILRSRVAQAGSGGAGAVDLKPERQNSGGESGGGWFSRNSSSSDAKEQHRVKQHRGEEQIRLEALAEQLEDSRTMRSQLMIKVQGLESVILKLERANKALGARLAESEGEVERLRAEVANKPSTNVSQEAAKSFWDSLEAADATSTNSSDSLTGNSSGDRVGNNLNALGAGGSSGDDSMPEDDDDDEQAAIVRSLTSQIEDLEDTVRMWRQKAEHSEELVLALRRERRSSSAYSSPSPAIALQLKRHAAAQGATQASDAWAMVQQGQKTGTSPFVASPPGSPAVRSQGSLLHSTKQNGPVSPILETSQPVPPSYDANEEVFC